MDPSSNGGTAADFPATAPAANPVFYRTYSRRTEAGRESWHQVGERNLEGLRKLGKLNEAEVALLARMQKHQQALAIRSLAVDRRHSVD
jgi:ribonucleotide reductase class II